MYKRQALLRTNAALFVLDPKNADLADLQAVMPDVYYKKEDMLACIDRFYGEMMKRSEDMKLMENYRTGENYAYLGLSLIHIYPIPYVISTQGTE